MLNTSNWYGWIPILTNRVTLFLPSGTPKRLAEHSPEILDLGVILSNDSSLREIDLFLKSFGEHQSDDPSYECTETSQNITYKYKATLTDSWLELIKRTRHPIVISLEKNGGHIKKCPKCNKKVLHIRVAILKPHSSDTIISADVFIHENGLVLYVTSDTKYSFHYLVNQVHKLVRDIFHQHVHHRSDLLLPTTESNDDSYAIISFQNSYITKFLSYKRLIKDFITNKTVRNYPEALILISLARGELLYAQNLIGNINKESREDNFFEYINKTLTSFEKQIETEKNTFFTLVRIGFAFCALIVSYLGFYFSEIPPQQQYLAKSIGIFVVTSLLACVVAFGTRFINTYRHKCFSRIFSLFR